jgi:electron transport complex protein RnfB
VCPVDCIYPDPDWTPSADDWWKHPGNPGDPYT